MEGALERIGKDDPDGDTFLRDLWEEGETEMVLDTVKSSRCEVRLRRPQF